MKFELSMTLQNGDTEKWHPPTFAAAAAMVESFLYGATGGKFTITKENMTGSIMGARWSIELR